MKFKRFLSVLLCFFVAAQCVFLPASATEVVAEGEDEGVTAPTTPEITFGNESILRGCRSIDGMVPLSGSERRLQSAQGVFVFDTKTDTVIYSYNPDMKMSPGTLTKLMTALVVLDTCDLDEVVVCHSKNISRLPGGSQNVKLKELEELTVENLLYCLLLNGANDAAVALAEHVAGNMTSFVTLMNTKARQLGCKDTDFGNVHGLDNATQQSTARDIARIYIEVHNNEVLREILYTTNYTVPATNKSEERAITTQNYLIGENIVAKYYDARVDGGLASYTDKAGASIVCSAKSDQLSLVLVIIGAERKFADNGWLPTYYGNFDEMIDLLEFSFNGFKSCRIMYEGQAMYQLPVVGGECDVVVQPKINCDSVLPADCKFDNLIKNITYSQLTAPIKEGDLVATISLSYRSSVVAEAELYAMCDVERATSSDTMNNMNGDSETGSGVVSVIVTGCLIVLGIAAVYLIVNGLRRAYGRAKRRRRRANRRRSW